MRALIDGNVLLDVLQNREPHVVDSAKVWKLCEMGRVEGYVSALTFSNLVYIMRRELTPERIAEVFKMLELIFRFTDLAVSDVERAVGMGWADFEDALQSVTAKRVRAERIVTRNVRDFGASRVVAVTPADFLAELRRRPHGA